MPAPDVNVRESRRLWSGLRTFQKARAVFFEDLARNLAPAHAMGFATVLVQSDKDWSHEPASARPAGIGDDLPPHIDYVTRDLTQFVRAITL